MKLQSVAWLIVTYLPAILALVFIGCDHEPPVKPTKPEVEENKPDELIMGESPIGKVILSDECQRII